MSDVVPAEAIDTYLELALAGDHRSAVGFVLDLLHDATPASAVITGLLAPAQCEVGERWHGGRLSTADEHLVTGVSQAALQALAAGSAPPEHNGLVLVACAEGDWHSLAAHMFAELLRAAGREVLYLGASTPAEDVSSFIQRRRPEAVTVTCNLALSYLGTARLVDAAHAHGVPVLAGGRALDPHRATVLGADGWAADSRAALRVLDQWRDARPSVNSQPVRLDRLALELEAQAPTIGARAYPVLESRFPPMASYDHRQRARTLEDLVYIVRFSAAARLVDDPSVFDSFRSWLRDLLVARGVPEPALTAGIAAVTPFVAEVDEGASQVLAAS